MRTQPQNKQLFKQSGLLVLALLALLMTTSVHAAAPIFPDDLTAAEWESIQAQIAAIEYQFAPVESGWAAPNRAQRWQTTFGLAEPQINPIAPWLQQVKLIASESAIDDYFGYSVAVSGDTAVIGAYGDDNNYGSAYVYVRSGMTWIQQQKLTASDAATGDKFGFSVAISGDTIVVGAYGDDSHGSAYVYVRSGTTWSQQAKLTASDAAADDLFGYLVAISGDTAVVGAPRDDSDRGSAYVFVRSGTTWSQQAKLTASDAAADDFFGWSVAVSGDTVIVGAYWEGSVRGSAYVFVRSGIAWSQQAKLAASDAAVGDIFGRLVAVSGDTVVVGAPGDDSYRGSVYVYVRSGTTWSQQAKLTASDAAANDFFGWSMVVSGDTVVIGAPGDDSYRGSTYVFVRSGTAWSQQARLTASDAAADDYFGWSMAVSGDTVVAGAYGDDSYRGSAYVFTTCIASAQSGTWKTTTTWLGGVAPTDTDGACINDGHTVTLDANVAVDTLQVFSGGILDLATYNLTAETGVWNYGTMRQTQTVDGSGVVNFLQIRDSGDTVDQYHGVDIAAGVNLGPTIMEVKGNTDVCNNNDGGSYRDRCFMVNPTNGGTVNITLHTTPGEDDLIDDAFFQYAGNSTWTQGSACADGAGVGGTCTGSATFASPAWFLIGSGGNAPTAISLQTIAASTNNSIFIVIAMMMVVGLGTAFFLIRRQQA